MIHCMNIERVTPDKLRVVLTSGDLDRYDLDYLSISSDSPATRRMVTDILLRANSSTGFRYRNNRLLIEVVPGRNNGCVLYLTSSRREGSEERPRRLPAAKKQSAPPPGEGRGVYIAAFAGLEAAIDGIGCFAVFADLPLRRSTLYTQDGEYRLVFAPLLPGLPEARFQALCSRLSEYGSTGPIDAVKEAMLAEHAQVVVAARAVERFLRYFA